MAGVVLEDLEKSFGRTPVVRALNIEVSDGEFLVLLGPSGCGKTTTLRIIAGLDQPTSGRIFIGGRLANNIPPSDRDVAMVFQNYALYPHMSVRQNLAYGLIRRGIDKRIVKDRVQRLAVSLHLEELLDRKPAQLSGGQRQRVALGRAVIREPKVFLMDEPLSNLDAKLRVEMRTEVVRLQAELGVTTIYVTHDQVEAMTMGHRVALMNQGRLEQVAPPLELFDGPRNRFVAEFMGHPGINTFNGSIVGDGDRRFEGDGIELPLPGSDLSGDGVVLGIRPQHIRAERTGPRQADVIGSGRVDFVEHLGTESFAILSVRGRAVVAAIDPAAGLARGDDVSLVGTSKRAYFFAQGTGERLGPAVRPPSPALGDPGARV